MIIEKLPNPHPGEILLEDFLIPMGISQRSISKRMKVHPSSIDKIVSGKRRITNNIDFKLCQVLKTSPGFWIRLQNDYDKEDI